MESNRFLGEQLNLEHGNEIKAWEQQKGESVIAFYYFQTFLNQGPSRSIKNIIPILEKEDANASPPSSRILLIYQRQNRWEYRAELWDRVEFAQITRNQSEQRRKEMRISIEEYQKVQHQMSKGLASLASKVLTRVHKAVDQLPESDWTLDRASRFMATLNSTATTASSLWNESLGVGKLMSALEDLDAVAAEQKAAFLAQECPPKVKSLITQVQKSQDPQGQGPNPEITQEPVTHEPGTQGSGTREPGTREPGTQGPGTQGPGAQD